MTTLLSFLFALALLVFIHELGHYSIARWCGVKVLRFSIGFGKPLVTWRVGADRTEWSLSPIPLGGYVKMLDEREDGEVDPKDAHRAFNRQSLAKRSAIVVAGPAANFLLAIFLYGVLAMSGLQEPAPVLGAPPAGTPAAIAGISDGDRVLAIDGTTVASFTDLRLRMIDGIVEKRPIQLRVAGAGGERTVSIDTRSLAEGELERDFTRTLGMELRAGAVTVGSVVGGSSAAAAGIVAGDEILSIDQQPIRRASELIDRVRAAADKPLQFTVRRGETELQLPVTPRGETEVAASDAGGGRVGKIGAALQQRVEMVTVDLGPVDAAVHGAKKTWDMSIFSLRMLGKMVTGDLSWKNLSGPVAIADFAGQSAKIGWYSYVAFLALISVSLGVLNLLPVPVLDGGHLVYYALEAIKGRPLSERFMQVTQKVGLAMVACLMIVALFNDLTRLLS
ncbi:MAG TPA: RIP metalloprotease RseP [Lautropia sp.]|nr:RIP metalloprotease RseP [Lautropia sp.]